MSTSLCLFLLAISAVPLSAQPRRLASPARTFPPDIISRDELPRDLVRVDTKHVRVDLENDRTRVLRLTLSAGESLPMHDDRAGVLVCISGCRLRLTVTGKERPEQQDIDLKPGETRWLPDARRALQNIAGAPTEFLYIETKRTVT